MDGIYSIDNPNRLFERLVRQFSAFCRSPSEDGIWDVIFPLYHLREWICPDGYKSYKHKQKRELSREEWLHAHLYAMPEYEIVRSLCNAAKHYSQEELEGRVQVAEGLRAGLARAGDSLGVTHFLVDGRDVRDFFWPVYQVYFHYFRTRQSEALDSANDY